MNGHVTRTFGRVVWTDAQRCDVPQDLESRLLRMLSNRSRGCQTRSAGRPSADLLAH